MKTRVALCGWMWMLGAACVVAQTSDCSLALRQLDRADAGECRLALRFRCPPGWHTYWLNPGDTGIPPRLRWELPEPWTVARVEWPLPQVFAADGLVSYGYEDEVCALVHLVHAGPAPAAPPLVRLHSQWLICAGICRPVVLDAQLQLQDTPPAAEDGCGDARPFPVATDEWTIRACVDGATLKLALVAARTGAGRVETPGMIFVEEPVQVNVVAATWTRADSGWQFALPLVAPVRPGTPFRAVLEIPADPASARRALRLETSVSTCLEEADSPLSPSRGAGPR